MSDTHPVALDELVELVADKIAVNKDPAKPYIGLEQMAEGSPDLLGTLPAAASTSMNNVFRPGDILFGKLRPNLRKSVRATFAGYCSTDILVLRARPGVDAAYAAKVFQWPAVFDAAVRTAEGTKMPRTSWAELRQLTVPRFGVDQQRRIAAVLDAADAAIRHTAALIAKLRQVKAGLLHDLLTRGLDECGRLRDPASPTEWRINALNEVAEIGSGVTLGRDLPGSGAIELPYLRVANVQDGYLDLTEIKTVRVLRSEVPSYLLELGDILMTEGGDFDKLGRGTVWRGEVADCLHQNHIFRVRVDRNRLLPDFLAAVTASQIGKRYFLRSSKQTTNLASINSTQLKAFPVPCPTLREQQAIIAVFIAHDSRIRAEQSYLAKLELQKRGLLHDLLTGRIRV